MSAERRSWPYREKSRPLTSLGHRGQRVISPPTDIVDVESSPETVKKPDGRIERGRLRQLALVEAARDLFILHGYRATTVEAIIARAGGSRETIYRVFGGKRGLFSAIIAQAGERMVPSIQTSVARALPPEDGLMQAATQLSEIWDSEEGRAINRVVISEGLDMPELVDVWYQGAARLSVAALAQYLEAQVDLGRMAPLDGPLVARQFVMLLIGEMSFPFISGDTACGDRRSQISRCVDLFMKAYATAS